MTTTTYTDEELAAVKQFIPIAAKRQEHWARLILDALIRRGWRTPAKAPTIRPAELGEHELCPSCNGNFFEHVLVAGPDGEPDYYKCIEEVLIYEAEHGNDVAFAAMAYIERLKEEAGQRGSMSSDNDPSFLNDPIDPKYPEVTT